MEQLAAGAPIVVVGVDLGGLKSGAEMGLPPTGADLDLGRKQITCLKLGPPEGSWAWRLGEAELEDEGLQAALEHVPGA